MLKNGAVLRTKIEPKIVLDSGAKKVVHLDAPRLANWTPGTSKIIEIHLRGCEFQLFALFSWKALFERFWSSLGLILGPFSVSF